MLLSHALYIAGCARPWWH